MIAYVMLMHIGSSEEITLLEFNEGGGGSAGDTLGRRSRRREDSRRSP